MRAHARHEHRELLAAPAPDRRVLRQSRPHARDDRDQHVVARLVPVGVVRALEVVDVEQEQAERLRFGRQDGAPRASSGSSGGSRAPSAGRCSRRARPRRAPPRARRTRPARSLSAAAMPSCASLRVVMSETMPSATTPPGSRRQRQLSTSQRVRPSSSQMRYSMLPGRPACCAASTSSATSARSSGWTASIHWSSICVVVESRDAEERRHRHRLEVGDRGPVDRVPPGVEVLVDRGEHRLEPPARRPSVRPRTRSRRRRSRAGR